MTQIIFRGWITTEAWGDNWDALYLRDPEQPDHKNNIPLAQRVIVALGGTSWDNSIKRTVRVGYLTSDQSFPATEFDEKLATIQMGLMEAAYRETWSEVTGYLWTDEHLGFNGNGEYGTWEGGHDIIAELRSHTGRWCHLVIDVEDNNAT